VWALSRLAAPAAFRQAACSFLPDESDAAVAEEWRAGLGNIQSETMVP
jgi:hypothetical protein